MGRVYDNILVPPPCETSGISSRPDGSIPIMNIIISLYIEPASLANNSTTNIWMSSLVGLPPLKRFSSSSMIPPPCGQIISSGQMS